LADRVRADPRKFGARGERCLCRAPRARAESRLALRERQGNADQEGLPGCRRPSCRGGLRIRETLSAAYGRLPGSLESRPGTPIWKRGRSQDERIPLLLGATSLAKDLLLNRLEIPLAGPGFIHIAGPERGFDEQWAREMTSERKEVIFRGGIQKTLWRRLSNSQSNDAWDAVATLIESMKLRLSEMKPDYYEPKPTGEESVGKNDQPPQPKWGAQPVNVGDPYIRALQAEQRAQRGQQQQPNGMRWGVQNRGVEW
jgi:hypothetical protein